MIAQSTDLLFGDSESPHECMSRHRIVSQVYLSFMSYHHTNMQFDWISQFSPPTDHHSRVRQHVLAFNALVLASSARTVYIVINWSQLTCIPMLKESRLEGTSCGLTEKIKLASLSSAGHMGIKEWQVYRFPTLLLSLRLLIYGVSSPSLSRASKQSNFQKNCLFSITDWKPSWRDKRSIAGMFTVRARRWELSIDI